MKRYLTLSLTLLAVASFLAACGGSKKRYRRGALAINDTAKQAPKASNEVDEDGFPKSGLKLVNTQITAEPQIKKDDKGNKQVVHEYQYQVEIQNKDGETEVVSVDIDAGSGETSDEEGNTEEGDKPSADVTLGDQEIESTVDVTFNEDGCKVTTTKSEVLNTKYIYCENRIVKILDNDEARIFGAGIYAILEIEKVSAQGMTVSGVAESAAFFGTNKEHKETRSAVDSTMAVEIQVSNLPSTQDGQKIKYDDYAKLSAEGKLQLVREMNGRRLLAFPVRYTLGESDEVQAYFLYIDVGEAATPAPEQPAQDDSEEETQGTPPPSVGDEPETQPGPVPAAATLDEQMGITGREDQLGIQSPNDVQAPVGPNTSPYQQQGPSPAEEGLVESI